MLQSIIKQINDSIQTKQYILENRKYIDLIAEISEIIIRAYKNGNKVILCGNGGSASDAQHIEGELVGRFKLERKALPAIAITANSSTVTAVGNDYGYDAIFERQVEAHAIKGDVLIAISTSGNSRSISRAIEIAKTKGLITVALLGKTGGICKECADISFVVPSDDTPRIQESHIMIGHIICDIVEKGLFA